MVSVTKITVGVPDFGEDDSEEAVDNDS